jgi:WD40 repeat protein
MALAFSPDGNVLISCGSRTREDTPRPRAGARPPSPSEETSIQCWDVATGNEIRRIGLGKARINAAVLAPDSKILATAATDTAVRLWDLTTGRELRQFGGSDVYTSHLAFSPDGTKLASTEWVGPALPSPTAKMPLAGPIHVWDTASGRELRNWEADNGSLAGFSRDGTTLVTAGEKVIRLWDVASSREIRPNAGHHSAIEDAAYTPDGRSIVTLGHDRTVRFWDPVTGREVRRFEAGDFGIRFAALSGDGKTLATGGGFQPTRVWDAASGRELRRFQTPSQVRDAIVECADLSPDGKTLATSVSRRVDFWDTVTGERRPGVAMSPIGTGFIKALRFAPDGRTVATVYGDWVRFWDAASSRETRRIALPTKGRPNDGFSRTAARLAFSPDGTTLAATNERDGLIFLLDVASGREFGRVDGPDDYKALAFSPDGKLLATGVDISKGLPDHELSVRLWDVTARKEIGRVPAHRNSIRALAFSPDGKRLLSASEDATALVWEVASLTSRGIVGPPPTALSNAGTPPVSR